MIENTIYVLGIFRKDEVKEYKLTFRQLKPTFKKYGLKLVKFNSRTWSVMKNGIEIGTFCKY